MPSRADQYAVEDIRPRRRSQLSFGEKCGSFLYDGEKGTYCNRTCTSWGKIGIFYLILYGALAGFWYGQFHVFLGTLNENYPTLAILIKTPGLASHPKADEVELKLMTPELKFKPSDADTYKEYTDQIQDLLDSYTGDIGHASDACTADTGVDTVCDVTKSNLGPCDGSDPNYGFDTGEPCMFFTVNKAIFWEPLAYSSNPEVIKIGARWDANSIALHCVEKSTADIPTDNDGLGTPSYNPGAGISFGCFPYCGPSVNHTQGIAAVKFTGLAQNRRVRVICSMYASNVEHSEKEKAGVAIFALYSDTS